MSDAKTHCMIRNISRGGGVWMTAQVAVACAAALTMLLVAADITHADIPDWVEDLAGFWSEGSIDDDTYLSAITWLMDAGLIVLPADRTPPTIIPPPDISVDAAGILTAVPRLGDESAAGAINGPLVITNDAPDMFPIGNTTITWNATDAFGNWAVATQLVSVSEKNLDSDWHYALRWHDGALGNAATVFSKHFDSLAIISSDTGSGTAYLFKTFRTDDIRDRSITIRSDAHSPHDVMIYVLDGAYSKHVQSDFTISDGPDLKGGGALASYALTELPGSFKPDWARSQLDETTIVISFEKRVVGSHFYIHSVEFDGHSKWTFEDYQVEQRGDRGTYRLLPTSASAYELPIYDTFDESLDGWTYWGHTSDYIFGYDSSAGMSPPSAFISMDQYAVFSGMSKTVDISGMQNGRNLVLSYDYRAASNSAHSTVTNSFLYVLDAHTREVLHLATPAYGGTSDTGWQSYSADLTSVVGDSDRIQIILGFHDSWITKHGQANWYDNVRLEGVFPKQADDPPDSDYYPVVRILHPQPGQFLAKNADAPGVTLRPDYLARLYDGTPIPHHDLDVAFVMHGPDPDNIVPGFYPAYRIETHEYGQATLVISYTDTVNGKAYTATDSVTFYMGSTQE